MLTTTPDPKNDDLDNATGSCSLSGSSSGSSQALRDELVRDGARRMLAAALVAEVGAYIDAHRGPQRSLRPRRVVTGADAVEVVASCVNCNLTGEATGEAPRFSSAIPPPWCRRAPEDVQGDAAAAG